jgi:hypothetical protein
MPRQNHIPTYRLHEQLSGRTFLHENGPGAGRV